MGQRHLSRLQEPEPQRLVHEPLSARHLSDAGEQPVRRARLVHIAQGARLHAAPEQPWPVPGDQDEERAAEPAVHRVGLLPELGGRVGRVAVGIDHADVGTHRADAVAGAVPWCMEHLQVRLAGEAFRQSRPQQTGVVHEKYPDHVSLLQVPVFFGPRRFIQHVDHSYGADRGFGRGELAKRDQERLRGAIARRVCAPRAPIEGLRAARSPAMRDGT
ncbi:hypothetical protein GCM10009837_30840 [Streptomyces durmitorensis]